VSCHQKIEWLGSPKRAGDNHRGELKTNISKLSSLRLIYIGKAQCKTAYKTGKVAKANGRGSTVNRVLDGSTYLS
jgi:hypothetical protein